MSKSIRIIVDGEMEEKCAREGCEEKAIAAIFDFPLCFLACKEHYKKDEWKKILLDCLPEEKKDE